MGFEIYSISCLKWEIVGLFWAKFLATKPAQVSIIPRHGFRWMTGGWNYGDGRTRVFAALEKFLGAWDVMGVQIPLSFQNLSVNNMCFSSICNTTRQLL